MRSALVIILSVILGSVIAGCGSQPSVVSSKGDSPAANSDPARDAPEAAAPKTEPVPLESDGVAPSEREPKLDEPVYQGVLLSVCIQELARGRYVDSGHFVSVMDRPEYSRQAFRHFGSRAAPLLASALKNKALVVRYNAVEALQEIGPEAKEAIPVLIVAAFKDDSLVIRKEAIRALGRLGLEAGPAVEALAKLLQETEQHFVPPHGFWRFSDAAQEALVQIGRDAIPIFADRLKDKDPTVRMLSVEALSCFQTDHEAVVPLLRNELRDPAPAVRAVAAESLGKFAADARPAAPDLAAMLTDQGQYGIGVMYTGLVCVAAAKALSRVGPTIAEMPALIAALKNDQQPEVGGNSSGESSIDWVRWKAAESLGHLGPAAKPAVAPLTDALQRKSIRCAIAVALTRIEPGHPETLAIIEESLSIDDVESRLCALRACQRLAKLDDGMLNILRLKARVGDNLDRVMAAATVIRLAPGDADTARILRELLGNSGNPVWQPFDWEIERWGNDILDILSTIPEAADMAVPAIMKNLHESWKSKWALESLGSIGPRAAPAVAELVELLDQQDDTEIRRVAAKALGKIGPAASEATGPLVGALLDPRVVVRASAAEAIGRIGIADATVIAGLKACLRDEYVVVRRNAVRALGQLGAAADSALPQIDALSNDPNPAVRTEAQEAIRRIRNNRS